MKETQTRTAAFVILGFWAVYASLYYFSVSVNIFELTRLFFRIE